MFDRTGNLAALCKTRAATAGVALLMLIVTASPGWPQTPSSPADPQTPAPQAAPDRPAPQPGEPTPSATAPAREENPGLINEMGKLFEKSLSILPSLKSPGETMDGLNTRAKDAAKDASDGLSRLAVPSSMVAGRAVCPVSTNGAPDCKAGADKLCQTKGFKEGKSLNTDSAEKCSAKVFLPGRKREPGDCRTENYVTRALCQ